MPIEYIKSLPSWKCSCCHITNGATQRSALASFSVLDLLATSRRVCVENGDTRFKYTRFSMVAACNWPNIPPISRPKINPSESDGSFSWADSKFFMKSGLLSHWVVSESILLDVKFREIDVSSLRWILEPYLMGRKDEWFNFSNATWYFTRFFIWHCMKFVANWNFDCSACYR